jgi:phosphoglycerate dehydrogenase-like enzyme
MCLPSAAKHCKKRAMVAKVLAVADPSCGDFLFILPSVGATLLEIGYDFKSFSAESLAEADVLLLRGEHDIIGEAFEYLYPLLSKNKLKWVHACSAGIGFLLHSQCGPDFINDGVFLTNARGCYSQALAEYTMCACLYFNKQTSLLRQNHNGCEWDQFVMPQLLGKTMGIVGYGDIGSKVATLAKAFNMKVWGLRSRPERSKDDVLLDKLLGASEMELVTLMQNADFIVVSLPSTASTENWIDKSKLVHMKKTAVIINIGRGSTLNEDDLCDCLEAGMIKGAALDVFKVEPLPLESRLWKIPSDRLLLSPHNADKVSISYKNQDFSHRNL